MSLNVSSAPKTLQRLRVTFARGEALKFISHLEMMHLWERALRRAGIPLAYSEGFTPHPKIAIAAPLAVGVTSEAELMDVFLQRRVTPLHFLKTLQPQLPRGIELLGVEEVGLALPSLQALMRYAEYEVRIVTDKDHAAIEGAIAGLLSQKSLPWERLRDGKVRKYDLRSILDDLWLGDVADNLCILGMRIRTDNSGSGRPEDVVAALGFDQSPTVVHRTRLVPADPAEAKSQAASQPTARVRPRGPRRIGRRPSLAQKLAAEH